MKNKKAISVSCILFVMLLGTTLGLGEESMKEDTRLLVDFSAGDEKDQWRIINDGVMGGLSQSRIDIIQDSRSNSIAVFQGELSLENYGGFASVRRAPRDYGIKGCTGISFRVKGDGRTYQFRIRTNNRYDGVAYSAEFQTTAGKWLTVKLPIDNFIPTFRGRRVLDAPKLRAENIRQIGFLLGDKRQGPFKLEIDWIKAYW